MKPFYRTKGKYKDGRQRIVIEILAENDKRTSIALPKPEKLLELLDTKDCPEE